MSSTPATSATSAQLHTAILQYLTQLQQAGAASGLADTEPLGVAIELLSDATGIKYDANVSVTPAGVDAGLLELFQQGVASVQTIESSAKWPAFLANLREKTDFFKGVQAGSLDHTQRMAQARAKFQAKFASETGANTTAAAAATAPAAAVAPVSDADKAAAEVAKNEGNALLGKGDHAGAAAKYTDAMRLNPTHAIYPANRAAAYVNLKQYEKAVADCRTSIALDPEYPKSRYRLGQSLLALGKYAEAVDAFTDALERAGSDEGMKQTIREQIKICDDKLNPPMQPHAGGADPFAALGNMFGGGAGGGGMDLNALMSNPMFSGLMNNPAIADAMKSPEMQNMMKNFDIGSLMKDIAPAAANVGEAARAAAPERPQVNTAYTPPSADDLFDDAPSATAAPAATAPAATAAAPKPSTGGLPPALSSFLATPAGQAMANDPDLKPVLEDVKANGVASAMKYMNNPRVMTKLQPLMAQMMQGKK